jgi:hypothetical protein
MLWRRRPEDCWRALAEAYAAQICVDASRGAHGTACSCARPPHSVAPRAAHLAARVGASSSSPSAPDFCGGGMCDVKRWQDCQGWRRRRRVRLGDLGVRTTLIKRHRQRAAAGLAKTLLSTVLKARARDPVGNDAACVARRARRRRARQHRLFGRVSINNPPFCLKRRPRPSRPPRARAPPCAEPGRLFPRQTCERGGGGGRPRKQWAPPQHIRRRTRPPRSGGRAARLPRGGSHACMMAFDSVSGRAWRVARGAWRVGGRFWVGGGRARAAALTCAPGRTGLRRTCRTFPA